MIINEHHLKQSGAIVTGGANGIGLAICRLLKSQGIVTACIDIDEAAMKSVDAHTFCCDVRDAEKLEKTIKLAEAAISGKYMYLFSIAGRALVQEFDNEAFPHPRLVSDSVDLNLLGHYNFLWASRHIIKNPALQKSIVLASSVNAIVSAGLPGYSAAKAGLLGLVTSLSKPFGRDYNATLNAALLGTVKPEDEKRQEPRNLRALEATTFNKKIMTSSDAAECLVWLAMSPRPLVGQAIVFDNGQTINFTDYIINESPKKAY